MMSDPYEELEEAWLNGEITHQEAMEIWEEFEDQP